MLDQQAPACRGSAHLFSAILLASLASMTLGGMACAVPQSPLPHGRATPPLALPSLDHGPQGLAALQGKVVLVHFFATWCEPCRDEMAALTRLTARMQGKPFAILAVDVGEVEVKVRRFFTADPVPFPIALDEDRAAMKAWKVEFYPTSYVLAADHTLQIYAAGPVDWDDPASGRALESLIAGSSEPGLSLPAMPTDSGSQQ